MMYCMSSAESLEIMARGIKYVPGLVRLFWRSADNLHSAWVHIKELKEYEETHATKRGRRYADLNTFETMAAEQFNESIEAITIILEALGMDDAHSYALEEVRAIADATTWRECALNAR